MCFGDLVMPQCEGNSGDAEVDGEGKELPELKRKVVNILTKDCLGLVLNV